MLLREIRKWLLRRHIRRQMGEFERDLQIYHFALTRSALAPVLIPQALPVMARAKAQCLQTHAVIEKLFEQYQAIK